MDEKWMAQIDIAKRSGNAFDGSFRGERDDLLAQLDPGQPLVTRGLEDIGHVEMRTHTH